VFDHGGTRFVTLDTSSLSLRGGGFAQIKALRAQLDAAADDPRVSSVMVIEHVPPRDPTVQKGSRLGDRKEAALLEDWLADFRRTSGKGAGFIGSHVGSSTLARRRRPVSDQRQLRKNPAAPADEGGFTGWSLVGVDEVSGSEQSEAGASRGGRARLGLRTDTCAHRRAGARRAVRTGSRRRGGGRGDRHPGTREVPVGFPMSADWTGSPNVHIGDRTRRTVATRRRSTRPPGR